MKISRLRLALPALLALVACGPRTPPSQGEVLAQAISPGSLVTPPVYSLLGYREQLELTSDQINAIDSIGTWLSRANGPLLDEQAAEQAAQGEPSPLSRLMRVGENNAAAVAGIQALLTPEQEREVCELFRSSDEERQPVRRTRRGAEPDSLAQLAAGTPWSWCVVQAAEGRR